MTSAAFPYVPVEGRAWRLSMGLRPLAPDRWLEVDRRRPADLERKAQLLAERHGTVFAATAGSEVGGGQLLSAVVAHLVGQHPDLVSVGADGRIEDRSTGLSVDPGSTHPVDAAARLVQEDLCLMERQGAGWVLTAASVCFPSRWRLAAKIGRDLSGIHAPVPGYEESLGAPTRAFFDRLRPERPVWRLNWTILDTPELHLPDPARRRPAGGERSAPDPGRDLWFRVERQTLRRLERSGAVAFTIRTYVTPLAELVDDHPEVAAALDATLCTVPPATLAYKGWSDLIGPLQAWLRARTGRPLTDEPRDAGTFPP